MLEIGSLLDGRYRIISKIGQSGMSAVYTALNERANRTWTVKEVCRDCTLDYEAVRRRLAAETDILKKLRHPGLPSVADVIDSDDSFIVILDYAEENTLSAALRENGVLPQDQVIEWAKQLCDVLAYLHSRKPPIIYRDMKPGNILLRPDGSVMLINFDAAWEFDEKSPPETIRPGTVGYAAPEQFGSRGRTDIRTDIYNLGATVYHLLTGRNLSEPPYEIRDLREANPALSPGLQEIIAKAVRPDPAERYQRAEEMRYELEHFSEYDRAYRKKEKRKLGVIAGLFGAAFLSVLAGFALRFAALRTSLRDYEDLLSQAETAIIQEDRMSLYEQCIEQVSGMAGRKDAYLGLMQACTDDDGMLSVDEYRKLDRLIRAHEEEIRKDRREYADICFGMGKIIWYYQSYGDSENRQFASAGTAAAWFGKVTANADVDDPNLGTAQVYESIGRFYGDIAAAVTEGRDRGMYRPFFENLQKLASEVGEKETEPELVRLELFEMCRSAIQQYAAAFRTDGISENELVNFLDMTAKQLREIPAGSGVTEEKRRDSLKLIPVTYESLRAAFSEQGGE